MLNSLDKLGYIYFFFFFWQRSIYDHRRFIGNFKDYCIGNRESAPTKRAVLWILLDRNYCIYCIWISFVGLLCTIGGNESLYGRELN